MIHAIHKSQFIYREAQCGEKRPNEEGGQEESAAISKIPVHVDFYPIHVHVR